MNCLFPAFCCSEKLKKKDKKEQKFSLHFAMYTPIMVVKSGLKWWEMEQFPDEMGWQR